MIQTVRGAKQLDDLLRLLPRKIVAKHLRKALRAGANVIKDEARRHAPVRADEARKTFAAPDRKRKGFKVVKARPPGFLRRQIIVGFRRQQVETGMTVSIGPSKAAFYGLFQELGTSRQAARPFLRPALDVKADEAIAAIGAELAKALRTGFR